MSHIPPPYPLRYDSKVDASGLVITDVPCRKCGYNLRGNSSTGRCPECGSAVGVSVLGDLLRFSDPQWVRGLKRGVRLIIGGIVVVIAAVILWIALSELFVATTFSFVGSVLNVLGAWMLTEPDPSGIGEEQYGTARKIIRFALIVGLANSVLQIGQRWSTVATNLRVMIGVLAAVAGLVGLVGQFAQLNYLSKLAMRIPDLALAQRARFLMWAIGISYGFILLVDLVFTITEASSGPGGNDDVVMLVGCPTAIAGLALMVFGIMYVLMLEKLGWQFAEQAARGEQTWSSVQQSAGGWNAVHKRASGSPTRDPYTDSPAAHRVARRAFFHPRQ